MSEELRQANLGVVREYVEALNGWDFGRMEAVMAEDFVLEFLFPAPGLQPRIEGREAMFGFQRRFAEIIESENLHDLELDTLHTDPGEVIASFKSDFAFVDRSRSYSNDYLCRFTVRDGRIVRFQENFDNVRLVESFGGTVESPFEADQEGGQA